MIDPMPKLTATERLIYRALEGVTFYLSPAEIARRAFDYECPSAADASSLVRGHISNMRRKGLTISSGYRGGYRLGASAEGVRRTEKIQCKSCESEHSIPSRQGRRRTLVDGWIPRAGAGWLCAGCAATEERLAAAASLAAWRARNAEAREVAS